MEDSRKTVVYVVDDDPAVRDSLAWLMESVQLRVKTFASARDFLEAFDPDEHGCLLLDVRMPGMSGLDLQEKLCSQEVPLPVIFITGHGDIPMAVRAMKKGAMDFIEKPFNDQKLLDLIHQAVALDERIRSRRRLQSGLGEKLEALSKRERQVMELVVDGKVNKEIADVLGISVKTVETHRANVMEKTGARSVAELVHMALLLRHAGWSDME